MIVKFHCCGSIAHDIKAVTIRDMDTNDEFNSSILSLTCMCTNSDTITDGVVKQKLELELKHIYLILGIQTEYSYYMKSKINLT
jgi:hypothetical protein